MKGQQAFHPIREATQTCEGGLALTVAVVDRQQLLAAVRIGADEDEKALPVVVETRREVDTVRPSMATRPWRDVDVAPGAEITPLPNRHHRRSAGPPIQVRRTRGQQTAAGRRTVEAESPGTSAPRRAASASSNWPVETPFG